MQPPKPYSDELEKNGVTVVRVMSAEKAKSYVKQLKWEVRRYPELKESTGELLSPVMGGFGAMGSPSSFHSLTVRRLRREIHRAVTVQKPNTCGSIAAHFRWVNIPKPQGHRDMYTHVQCLMDRLSWRQPGTGVGGESFHRDVSPDLTEAEKKRCKCKNSTGYDATVTGGWLNLDDKPQYFSCVLGTHPKPEEKRSSGFVPVSKEEAKEYRKRRTRVVIPPGCFVCFYNQIVHEVLPTKQPAGGKGSWRLYCGFRWSGCSCTPKEFRYSSVTSSSVKGFGSPLDSFGSPLIPSGQRPPTYDRMHLVCWKDRLLDFSTRFVPHLVTEKGIVMRFLPPLASLRSVDRDEEPKFLRPYRQADKDILAPSPYLVPQRPSEVSEASEARERGPLGATGKGARRPPGWVPKRP